MAAAGTVEVRVILVVEITHAAPADGEALTPCCGHTPFELKRSDRLTTDPALVTCPGAWLNRTPAPPVTVQTVLPTVAEPVPPTPHQRSLLPCPDWDKHRFATVFSGRGPGWDHECSCGAIRNRYPVC